MEPIERFDTKSRLAYDAIKKSVIDGAYLPGQKVGISQVARRLNTSDIPVREAMQRLEAEGFLEYTPHIGFRVTRPAFDKYTDLYEVRQLLEGEAAGKAARNISADSLAGLKRLHEQMRAAAKGGDPASFSDLNQAFHALIFVSSGNPVLVRQIEQVGAIYPRTRAIFVMFPQRTASAQREHAEIIKALEQKDPDGARRTYLDHMAKGYELLLKYHHVSRDEGAPPRAPGRTANLRAGT
jgi:DNA-binding GntR family transcriptional regulator